MHGKIIAAGDTGDRAQPQNRGPREGEYLLDVADVLREARAPLDAVVAHLAPKAQRDAPRGEDAAIEGVSPDQRSVRVIGSLLRCVRFGDAEILVHVLDAGSYPS